MNPRILVLLATMFLNPLAAKAQFLKNVPPERARAAGLEMLNDDQKRELEALVQLYKDGELEAVKAAAEKQAVEAEARLKQAQAATPKSEPDWVGGLTGSAEKAQSPKKKAVESRLIDPFWGWNGGTVFRLENGQVWQQAIPSEFYQLKQPIVSARVRVYPGIMGYLLEIVDTETSLKVKLVKTK